MTRFRFRVLAVLTTLGLAGVWVAALPAGADERASRHVLLISVDGLHEQDLAWYVAKHPGSTLAELVRRGVNFTGAMTPFPSDSFPGMVGQVTGGNPKSTGVYYDDTWNHALLPTGTTSCAGVAPGVEATYFEQLDKNPLSIDAGQGLAGLPDSILNLTSDPNQLIDPTQLPVDPTTCKPVYPNQYLKVNTVFEVARAAGLRTAWSDKHPAYQILSGPSGKGVQDYFTPEINSNASFSGAADWTKDNSLTQIYDGFKVQALINEIDGFDHSGKTPVGTPSIFGMNFQTISTAEKLPGGGYMADGVTPSAMLEGALNYINDKVGSMVSSLRERDLLASTTIILSAKHGQSPTRPTDLTRIDDGAIQDALNAAWRAAGHSSDLVAFAVNDDGWLDVDDRPFEGRHRLRRQLPEEPLRRGQRHNRRCKGLHALRARPQPDLRRRRRSGVHGRARG
ncbi:MAG TPA: alkaline phosphatase family protein [Candidatus Dormibacteraeota bacterium]|nr:alkaline phosphatase family protein [Candidatus Dormibacteraeota bacterium]